MADPNTPVIQTTDQIHQNATTAIANEAAKVTAAPVTATSVTPVSVQEVGVSKDVVVPEVLNPSVKPQEMPVGEDYVFEGVGKSKLETFLDKTLGWQLIRTGRARDMFNKKLAMVRKKANKGGDTVVTKEGKYGS